MKGKNLMSYKLKIEYNVICLL